MFEKIGNFFKEVKVEMKKVTWPTRDELKDSTKLVIIASVVVSVFIGVVDNILSFIIRYLLGW
jgi:preprotein translocase subunit SecE